VPFARCEPLARASRCRRSRPVSRNHRPYRCITPAACGGDADEGSGSCPAKSTSTRRRTSPNTAPPRVPSCPRDRRRQVSRARRPDRDGRRPRLSALQGHYARPSPLVRASAPPGMNRDDPTQAAALSCGELLDGVLGCSGRAGVAHGAGPSDAAHEPANGDVSPPLR
jgi:hypothetical protein